MHGQDAASSIPGDPALQEAVAVHGLHGFMLLSRELWFEGLDSLPDKHVVAAGCAPLRCIPATFTGARCTLMPAPHMPRRLEAGRLKQAIKAVGAFASVSGWYKKLEAELQMGVAAFQAVPSASRDGPHPESAASLYDPKFDTTKRDFVVDWEPSFGKPSPTTLVLGRYQDPGGNQRFSVRKVRAHV